MLEDISGKTEITQANSVYVSKTNQCKNYVKMFRGSFFERLLRFFKLYNIKDKLKLVITLRQKAACDAQCQTTKGTSEAFNRHFYCHTV